MINLSHARDTLATGWQWLTLTTVEIPEPARRRARLLAVFIFLLIVSVALFSVLVLVLASQARLGLYGILLIGLLGLFVLAFVLNRTGQYRLAADLVVSCTMLGTWSAILLNLDLLSADSMPLLYLVSPMLLSSFLLPARETVILGAVQFLALLLLTSLGLLETSLPLTGILSFILFIFVLCIVSSIISSQDVVQIDRQTRQLLESQTRLRELVVRDSLTGLFNRRYLTEILDRELEHAEREHGSVGIMMVDVDYFKGYNDALGHAAGDALLCQLSSSLVENIREIDTVCRYGGDEMTVILPGTTREIARARAEELHQQVNHLLMHSGFQVRKPVTISLGVATFPEDGKTSDEVLRAADDALYTAKRLGRDRVSVAQKHTPASFAVFAPDAGA